MSTVQTLIDSVNLPGETPDSIKYRWLSELNGVQYRYPDDADKELKYSDNLCEKYLIAMSDFFSGDMDDYIKSSREFKIAYARESLAKFYERRKQYDIAEKVHDTE
jgi:hypothetical protein